MQYRQVRSQHKEKSSEQTEVWLKSGSTIAEADLGIKVGPTKGMGKFCHWPPLSSRSCGSLELVKEMIPTWGTAL